MHNRTYDRSNVLHNRICIGLNVLYGEMALFCFQNSYICIKQTSFLLEQICQNRFQHKRGFDTFSIF